MVGPDRLAFDVPTALQHLERLHHAERRLAQLLDAIYLGDWTSYYLALENDVDPGPIDAIAQLKSLVAR
jgi:glucose/mannose-6-phosphate isomerase